MKFIPEDFKDLFKLAGWYARGDITGEEYYDAVDRFAEMIIQNEIEER